MCLRTGEFFELLSYLCLLKTDFASYIGKSRRCIIRNFIIYRKDIKIFSYAFWPYVLAALMGVMGALSWQGPMSLLVIVALAANTLFLYFPNVQNLRKSIVITSTMVLIYNAYFSVWGGVFNEAIAISSSIIGIYRYRNAKQ